MLRSSDPRLPALSLFVQALGGGMSSRLFQELREDRGLAYSVSAWQQAYGDTGLVALSCEAGLLMGMESAQGRADQMARSIEVFGRLLPLDELLGQLRDVDARAAREAGAALLDGRAAVASVGAQLALAA